MFKGPMDIHLNVPRVSSPIIKGKTKNTTDETYIYFANVEKKVDEIIDATKKASMPTNTKPVCRYTSEGEILA